MGKGLIFVIIQFLSIFFLLRYTLKIPSFLGLLIQILAILLGLWSIYEVRKSKLSILPEIRNGAELIRSGPYRLIRHPMYSSILLFFSPNFFTKPDLLFFIVYFILLVNLLMKLKYEENLLIQEFKDYKTYRKESYYLLPYVY